MSESKELNFTDNELKSIAVNAMGKSSEAGTKSILRIGLAVPGEYLDNTKGLIYYPPKETNDKKNLNSFNSGFSIGMFQWDIGQKRNAKEIIETYNNSNYIKENSQLAIPEKDVERFANVLQQNRERDEKGNKNTNPTKIATRTDIRWHPDYSKSLTRKLNNFFLTDEGYKFVMSLQEKQYEANLKPKLEKALESHSIQNMSREDAVEVLAAIAKIKNQSGSVLKGVSEILEDKKSIYTKQEIIDKIKSTYGKYVDDGVAKSLKGAELYNTLSNDKGKLGEIFKEQNSKNPFEVSNFHENPNAQLVDAMFRNPKEAQKLIEAVNEGKDYKVGIADKQNNKDIEKEMYIIGVKDGTIFTAKENKDGEITKIYKLENNEWKEFDNNKEKISDKNDNLTTSAYEYKTELSPEMIEFAKEQLNKDILSDEFKEKLLITQNTFELCDKDIKDCILNPVITNEKLQEFVKELEKKENAKAMEKDTSTKKDKDDDSVRTMNMQR